MRQRDERARRAGGGRGGRRRPGPIVPALVAFLALALTATFGDEPTSAAGVRTFTITASRYHFDPPSIEVREGEHVRLLLHSADTTHGLAIEALGVKVTIPKGGEVVSVEFVAGAPGRYVMKCSEYCGSGHRRMRGELVVREEGA
jgi:cytochrome c oxidase subunit 2